MTGVAGGFYVLVSIGLLGYLLARIGVLPAGDRDVLSRVAFNVTTPALLFTTVAKASVSEVVSPVLVTTVVSTVTVFGAYALVARFLWRRQAADIAIGGLCSAYVNAGNLGVPVAIYVLGDAAFVAPVLLFQLLILAPVAFVMLDRGRAGGAGVGQALLTSARNPLLLASLAGLLVAAVGWQLPEMAMRPVGLLAAAAIPVALLAYGMSLHGAQRLGIGGHAPDLILVVGLKAFGQPLVAFLVASVGLGLEGRDLLAPTLFAALPTAQQVYIYASRYTHAMQLARDAAFLSTIISVPVMLLVSTL